MAVQGGFATFLGMRAFQKQLVLQEKDLDAD